MADNLTDSKNLEGMDISKPHFRGDDGYSGSVDSPSAPPPYESKTEPGAQTEADEDDFNDFLKESIERKMNGFNENNLINVKLIEKKGWKGIFFTTKKFEVKGKGGKYSAEVKTDPSSCDCCIDLLFCGCLKKPMTFNVKDDVGNNVFQFRMLANCFGVRPAMEIITGDEGKLVGRIVKNWERFSLKGPWSAVFFKWSEMKFYASCRARSGKDVNIGVIRRLKSCASLRVGGTLGREDHVTKLLLLASVFIVDFLYYKQGQNDKPVPYQ